MFLRILPQQPGIVVLIAGISGLLLSMRSVADDVPERPERSLAPTVLSQVDADGLLHGLPQRLAGAITPSERSSSRWTGVADGGRLELDIVIDGDVTGEIFVGFFSDARWWIDEPVQVRRFPGAGEYTVENLIPGKFWIGAMIGLPPDSSTLGIHESWPEPVEIPRGATRQARVIVSERFRNRPAGQPGLQRGFSGQWDRMNPANLAIVRTIDEQGRPVPFCRVVFQEFSGEERTGIRTIGTDRDGYGYCDSIDTTFTLTAQRFDFVPELMASRWESRQISAQYDVRDRPIITVQWGPFPSGQGRVLGRVHNQFGKPLTEYFLTLTQSNVASVDATDEVSHSIRLPVIDRDGRFELSGLPSGVYVVGVRHFDYPTHVHRSGGRQVSIPGGDEPPTELDIEVEARELLYGRAVYADGSPVRRGYWSARIARDRTFALEFDADGSFRVPLSSDERRSVLEFAEGLIHLNSQQSPGPGVTIHVKQLSEDPNQPHVVTFPVEGRIENDEDDAGSSSAPRATSKSATDQLKPKDTGGLDAFALVATDGRTHSLADLKGHPVLINFFATWCGPCREELPRLSSVHEEYESKGLKVLLVSRGEEPEVVERFARRKRYRFPILVDQSRTLDYAHFVAAGEKIGLPTTLVLDREHRVVYAEAGFDDETFTNLKAAVQRVVDAGSHD